MAYVYRHIRLDKNQPFYIGIGSDDKGKYKRAYVKSKRNKYWHNIVSNTAYRVEILMDDLTIDEAKKKEIEFIKLYGRINYYENGIKIINNENLLCNLTDGGDESSFMKGHKFSDDHKNKISNSLKGRTFSEEHKLKLYTPRKGRKISEEALLKRRAAKVFAGNKNPNYKGSIILEKDGTIKEFTLAKSAAEFLGIGVSYLYCIISGSHKNTTPYNIKRKWH